MSLERARKSIGWDLQRLAREAGEKHTTIWDIEAKRTRNATYPRVVRIFRALRCGGLKPSIGIDDIFPVPDPPACSKSGTNGRDIESGGR